MKVLPKDHPLYKKVFAVLVDREIITPKCGYRQLNTTCLSYRVIGEKGNQYGKTYKA